MEETRGLWRGKCVDGGEMVQGSGNGESTTAWIECKLQNEITDPAHCAKCTKREDKQSGTTT